MDLKEELQILLKKELSEHLSKISQDTAKIKLDHYKTSIWKNLIIGGLFGLGFLFLLLGFAKYLPRLVKISEGGAFLVIGAALIVFALIYRAGGKS